MPYLFVGAGQAGSAIVDDMFEHERLSTIGTPLVFNSTVRDLQNLSNIGPERWYGIAERNGLVDGTEPGFEEQVTGGFGRNPVKADAVMDDHRDQIVPEFERRFGETSDIPFVFVFIGLGGGTGCGIAPHLAEKIKEYTEGAARVIAVGVLPNMRGPIADEEEAISASRQAWNTIYGLDRLEEVVDGIILVDNQLLAYEDAAEGRFSEFNEYVADAIVDLISGPVLERIDPSEYEGIDTPVIDLQDIVTSLSFDVEGMDSRPGYATFGRSVTMTKSLLGYLVPFVGYEEVDTAAMSRIASEKQTVEGVDPEDAVKALGLVRAPAEYIVESDRRIKTSVIRQYLQSRTALGEVNLGVSLTERNLASLTTVFTFDRADLGRLAQIERKADEYADDTEAAHETVAP